MQAPMISAGAREPAAARSAMTLAGTSCTEAVLSAQKSACASVAVPGCGERVSSSCIAFTPKGVAAGSRAPGEIIGATIAASLCGAAAAIAAAKLLARAFPPGPRPSPSHGGDAGRGEAP